MSLSQAEKTSSVHARLKEVRHFVLDMDGTIYLGDRLFDCTPPFLAALKRWGIGHTFLTNNNSRGRREYLLKLKKMGIETHRDQMFLSTDATVEYLRRNHPKVRELFVLGTAGLCEDLIEAGYTLSDREPQAVVVGYDTGLSYDRLCRAAWWISRGLPYIATHPDRVCPTDQPLVLPDCAAICALLDKATGREPEAVCGKPNEWMLRCVAERHGLRTSQVAMVGDRIYTDMEMARRAGAVSILVLSGEATAEQAAGAGVDCVARDLGELQQIIEPVQHQEG